MSIFFAIGKLNIFWIFDKRISKENFSNPKAFSNLMNKCCFNVILHCQFFKYVFGSLQCGVGKWMFIFLIIFRHTIVCVVIRFVPENIIYKDWKYNNGWVDNIIKYNEYYNVWVGLGGVFVACANNHPKMVMTHTIFSSQSICKVLTAIVQVGCNCSEALFLCFFDARTQYLSRNFRCVHLLSLPTIFALSQSIFCSQAIACRASPPSPVFMRFSAISIFPSSKSAFVNLTLSWCWLFRVSHFLFVSPMYPCFWHLQGMLYTMHEFLSPNSATIAIIKKWLTDGGEPQMLGFLDYVTMSLNDNGTQ